MEVHCHQLYIIYLLMRRKLDEANTHPPIMERRRISGLHFVVELAGGAMSSVGMQKPINSVKEFCDEWELKTNTARAKMIIFKKGEILSKNEKWKLVEETGVKK
jgi:hypothetical protein